MSTIVTENATLRCTKGTAPAPLSVTSQAISKVNGLLVATEMDKAPIANIPCFGTCMMGSTPPPCVPSPLAWQNTANVIAINGLKSLTKDSTLPCAKGGTISLVSIPQAFVEEK